MLTDGDAALMAGAPALGADAVELVLEAHMPYRQVFDVVWSGRRHIMMMATQIDRDGQPEHLRHRRRAPGPRCSWSACAGHPGNTVNHPTSYWVPDHSARTFVEQVDVVCGVGYARAEAAGAGATRFHDIRRVVSNLGVFDFETPERTMRLASVHPGVSVDEVVAATGFELVVPDDVAETRLPTPEELELLRQVLDPRARCATARSTELSGAARPRRHAAPRRCAPSFCELVGVRYPIVQTGHGLGGRAAPGGRHRRSRRAGHPGLGHHDARRSWRRPSARCAAAPTRPSG